MTTDRQLRFRDKVYEPGSQLVMAIVNRTTDSFYDHGATWSTDRALHRVDEAISQGADILDIGGVKAGPGEAVDAEEEIRRTIDFIDVVRRRHPDVVISIDTWRAAVAARALEAGADLINDAWGGFDQDLAGVAADYDAAIVCTHTGGLRPRTGPVRAEYDDVVADAIKIITGLAERARAAGVAEDSIIIDPAHDFGKNTWHSLEITRRLDELADTGWPVLVSVSNKDFLGETLDLPVARRVPATLAATAICAWQGARIHRVHQVAEARQVVDLVVAIRGDRDPLRTVRGLV
ncbi:dihydropteroate synthase [Microlunatus elymi]|uniref:Dihydropteroate synthase n=1 Tax=Microlunatus elymi TaxID=2596828 RepID=A0A516PY39_9ACTN|nr:dihydropteroate synthase [Microlunatus elymi]QDP96087.1 dihydropteroate synthase [Microlunatus elymi]